MITSTKINNKKRGKYKRNNLYIKKINKSRSVHIKYKLSKKNWGGKQRTNQKIK
jgi:hypothetical protein